MMMNANRNHNIFKNLDQFFMGFLFSVLASLVLFISEKNSSCKGREIATDTAHFLAGMVTMVGYLKNRKVDVLGFSFGVMVNLKMIRLFGLFYKGDLLSEGVPCRYG